MVHLLGDEQHDTFKQLVAVEGGDSEVEEETVENWTWNQRQLFDEQNRQTDQYVRQDSSHARLTHAHDPFTTTLLPLSVNVITSKVYHMKPNRKLTK